MHTALRHLAITLLLAVPLTALAAAYGGAQGTNRRGEIIRIEGDTAETLYVQRNAIDTAWAERYVMAEECPVFTETTLSCPPGRKSPLSGTTYRITTSKKWTPCDLPPYHDKGPGTIYVCIAGCNNPRAPKVFRVQPWEC